MIESNQGVIGHNFGQTQFPRNHLHDQPHHHHHNDNIYSSSQSNHSMILSLLLNNNNTYDYPSFIQTSTSSNHRKTLTNNMAVISEIEEHENKIVNEFCMLLEKSRQLFNGLR